MVKALNLPQEYFQCPELSKRETQYLIQKAQDSAKALVESARSSHGPVRWIEAGSHKGVQMYKGEGRNPSGAAEQIQYVCGATTIQASIEEVAAFMDVSTTPKFKAYIPHQHELLDGVVLYTLVPPSPETQFLHQVTVKWSAAHVPSKLIKNRDFLTLECQDVFTDTTGRRGWVRSYHSVKLPCCPDLQAELGFVRGSFYHTGYVFVESERAGWLDCIHTCQVNLKGSLKLPSSVYFLAMRRRIASVAGLGRALQQRRLGRQAFLSDLELVPKSQRSRCHVCAARFGLMTRKSRCRKCGEVVCGQCTQTWEVSLPKSGVKKVRVCATCACTADAAGGGPNSHGVLDEISLLSSASHESDPRAREYEYHDHSPAQYQVPLQLKSTILEDAPMESSVLYGASAQPPMAPMPPPPGPLLASQSRYSRSQMPMGPPPPSHAPPRRSPSSFDPEPYRPIGFVHQSEYDHPRHEPPRGSAPGYTGAYHHQPRESYREEYALPPPPRGYEPRAHSEMVPRHAYRDEYGYYAPPPQAHHGHNPGMPARQYSSESMPRNGKPFRHASEETASSSSDSLTAHALERHTRQMGRPGPVSPDAYDNYDRPVGPPPPPQGHYQQPPPAPYHHHHGPGYPPSSGGYAPHPQHQHQQAPPPQYYRDSTYERAPSRHSVLSMHSDYHARPSGSYADADAAHLRSSLHSYGYGSDHGAEGYNQSGPPPAYQPDPRLSLPASEPRPLQEQIVPEHEPVKTTAPAPATAEPAEASPKPSQEVVAPAVVSRSPSPDQEAALALAANATRLMQQQQEIQEQLQARAQALSFSSDQRYVFDEDDEEDDDHSELSGADGLEDWSTTSPATRAMLNEFKSLDIGDETTQRMTTSSSHDSYRFSANSSMLESQISFDDMSTRRSAVEPESETTVGAKAPAVSSLSVVQLYQKILELTKQQHSLENDANATAARKEAVARDLKTLYKQLHELTNEQEVAF